MTASKTITSQIYYSLVKCEVLRDSAVSYDLWIPSAVIGRSYTGLSA